MDLLLRRRAMMAQGSDNILRGYDIVGSPIISGNIMTPNDPRGFICTNIDFDPPATSSWKLQTKVRLNTAKAWCDIISVCNADGTRTYSLAMQTTTADNSRRHELYASSNGTNWNLFTNKCPGTFSQINQWYVVQVVCTYNSNNTYTLKTGFPLTGTWATPQTVNSHPLYGKRVSFGGGFSNGALDADFDLSETKIIIDDVVWWSAI